MKYAVVEIAGRQYKVEPDQELLVNFLGDTKKIDCDVLLLADEKSVSLGKPYLKEKLSFDIVETVRGKKIRVSRYHAKANTRRVVGSRATYSKVKLSAPKKSVKKA